MPAGPMARRCSRGAGFTPNPFVMNHAELFYEKLREYLEDGFDLRAAKATRGVRWAS